MVAVVLAAIAVIGGIAAGGATAVLVLLLVFWVLVPTLVAQHIGAEKGRMGWAWGFFLGWFGVLIVAILGPPPEIVTATPSLGGSPSRAAVTPSALDIAQQRYARGEISRDEFLELKGDYRVGAPHPGTAGRPPLPPSACSSCDFVIFVVSPYHPGPHRTHTDPGSQTPNRLRGTGSASRL